MILSPAKRVFIMRWQHENFHQDHIFTIGQNAIGHINGADVLLIEFFKKFELGHKIIA